MTRTAVARERAGPANPVDGITAAAGSARAAPDSTGVPADSAVVGSDSTETNSVEMVVSSDSTAVQADSTGGAAVVKARGVRAAPELRQGRFDQPRFVMLRSLLLPGWGQFHNRAWFKSALVAGGEAALIVNLIRDARLLKRIDAEVLAARKSGDLDAENLIVERYNARLDRYVGRQWLLGGMLAYALMDAYVDAHFVNFKIQFENDPARPAGARMGLEKRF
ncbi:MAG: DUF5683 domain-containing protein [Candidatus Eisenbacteria bacterium]